VFMEWQDSRGNFEHDDAVWDPPADVSEDNQQPERSEDNERLASDDEPDSEMEDDFLGYEEVLIG